MTAILTKNTHHSFSGEHCRAVSYTQIPDFYSDKDKNLCLNNKPAMRIHNLTENSRIYTSNAYLLMGEWNVISDINTLIDCGQDPLIFQKLESINTGLGKNKIDRLILTHTHSDHAALADEVKKRYKAEVLAYSNNLKAIDKQLTDEEQVKIGDLFFEVFHISAHSYDSICLYNENEKILFSGDTSFPIRFENEKLETENFAAVFRLSKRDIRHIYPGHGPVMHFDKHQFKVLPN